MSALGGGTSLTVAMAFYVFFGSISLLFYFAFKAKKQSSKMKRKSFIRIFASVCGYFFMLVLYIV